MCAINPAHHATVTFEVYTSDSKTTKEKFIGNLMEEVLKTEIELNSRTKLRWHVQEPTYHEKKTS